MNDTVLIEEMTWPEVKAAIEGGKRRVIVMLGAMEQHGPHLPIGTDTYLGYATGERLARRLGDALVAPVVTLGYSAGHLPMAGTVSIEEPTLERVIMDVCRSLGRHGFREIILLCSGDRRLRRVAGGHQGVRRARGAGCGKAGRARRPGGDIADAGPSS